MNRIKVFEVIECGGPGGTGAQVAAICNHLDPKKFGVDLVYAVRPGCTPEEYRNQVRGAEKAFYIPEMAREISPLQDLRAFQALHQLFKTEKPDVVHAHSSKAGALARLAAWKAGVPRIYYSPRGYSFQMQDRPAVSRLAYRIIERSLSWIGETIAISASEEEFAKSISSGKNIRTVCDAYLGPLPELRERPERTLKIGACGRLTYARNPEAFVKLAQRVTDSRNDVGIVWIGDGERRPVIDEMITDMNLRTRFEVTGWLSPEAVGKRLADIDIFVHFSRWEGLPNAVLEAMAYGLPVVASDIPGNRDVITHGVNGYLVKTEIELLERVLELVDQPELRRKMGQAGRQRLEKDFTLDKTISALEKLYSTS